MPNWVDCRLTVAGPPAVQEEFRSLFFRDGSWNLDFNTLVPYPEEYARKDREHDEAVKRWKSLSPEEQQENLHLRDTQDGYNNGGYAWCIRNWGVKWNLGTDVTEVSQGPRSTVLRFDTPWSPPTPFIEALSRKIPRARITLKYREEGMGLRGRYVVQGGEELDE